MPSTFSKPSREIEVGIRYTFVCCGACSFHDNAPSPTSRRRQTSKHYHHNHIISPHYDTMANLYIFQALYGPKPSVPTSDKAIESSNDISTAGPSNATASLETVTATLENVTASLEKATASPVNDTVSVVNTASNTEAVIPAPDGATLPSLVSEAPLHPERQQLIKTEGKSI
jgi:hypothetical protein